MVLFGRQFCYSAKTVALRMKLLTRLQAIEKRRHSFAPPQAAICPLTAMLQAQANVRSLKAYRSVDVAARTFDLSMIRDRYTVGKL
jgi:hypothetical protein